MQSKTTCPGCGLSLPKLDLMPNIRFNASVECLELFGQVSDYTLSLMDPEFIHQTVVDAYEAQHSGGDTKNITGAFGLMGLYLSIERGYTGRQVQKAHMTMGKLKNEWPRFEPPDTRWIMTIEDVLRAEAGVKRNESIYLWAKSVWQGWEKDHAQIIDLVQKNLPL